MTCAIWERQRDGGVTVCGDVASAIVNNWPMCQAHQDEWSHHLPSLQKSILLSDRQGK